MIFWAAVGYLLASPSFRVALPLAIFAVLAFLATGFLKNRAEHRDFRDFIESQKRDKSVQEKLKDEAIYPGDKAGRAKVRSKYRDRNTGLNWTGASVHGAVPHRKKRRDFLSKNR